MYALKVLHKKLRLACPFIHQKRLSILLLATQALMVGQRLSLTQLGRCLCSKAITKHKIKRIDRLLGNPHLHQERIEVYRFICSELLKGQPHPLIIVDWSDVTLDQHYHVLRASIPVGGRALTLYEEVHPQKLIGNRRVQSRFLAKLSDMLPRKCRPIVVTDAGFRTPWFKAVQQLGWNYVGRIRGRDMIKPIKREKWIPWKTLCHRANYRPRYLGEYTVVKSNPIDSHLYLVKQKPKGRHCYNYDGSRAKRFKSEEFANREKEPWLITTSMPGNSRKAKRVIKLYKTRMQIEEAFRDVKSTRTGFNMSESLTRSTERLDILLMIGALATLMTWLLGILAELKQWHRQYQSNTNKKRRVLSTFFIGCQVAKDKLLTLKPREYRLALAKVRTNALEQYYA